MRDAGESGVSPTWSSPEWAARREVEVLKLLCDGNVAKMQKLWLRKQRSVASCSRQPAGAQPRPSQSRAAGQKLEPAAQPKQRTPAQAARRERSLKQLRQKHLASRLWCCVRVAVRLQAWRVRATSIGVPLRCCESRHRPPADGPALFGDDGRFWSVCGGYRRVSQHRLARKVLPKSFLVARPVTAATEADHPLLVPHRGGGGGELGSRLELKRLSRERHLTRFAARALGNSGNEHIGLKRP